MLDIHVPVSDAENHWCVKGFRVEIAHSSVAGAEAVGDDGWAVLIRWCAVRELAADLTADPELRARFACDARYTWPMPPAPSTRRIAYPANSLEPVTTQRQVRRLLSRSHRMVALAAGPHVSEQVGVILPGGVDGAATDPVKGIAGASHSGSIANLFSLELCRGACSTCSLREVNEHESEATDRSGDDGRCVQRSGAGKRQFGKRSSGSAWAGSGQP